jgi:proteasome lid subunit RPN8/RPN11
VSAETLVLAQAKLRDIAVAAESAYPDECCGLLVGRSKDFEIIVTRVVASPNLALDDSGRPRRADRFEVDPELRLAVMRACEGTDQALVGHYHSHPDHPVQPSDHDLEMVLEPELVWLIIAVDKGKAGQAAAFKLDEAAHQFRKIPLRIAG